MNAMKKKKIGMALLIGGLGILCGCGASAVNGKSADQIKVSEVQAGASVHDPTLVMGEDGTYYLFGSHMEAAKSTDLQHFTSFASGVNGSNPLFDNLFDEKKEAFSFTGKNVDGGYAVWAPDVIYNESMKKWVMYFSTSYDYRTSNICMATADTIEGPYTYQKTILYSGFTTQTIQNTNLYEVLGEHADVSRYLSANGYQNLLYPNCIDPTVFYDKDGKMWMSYGSWSGGIFLLEMDQATGLPIYPVASKDKETDPYYGTYLIGGMHASCEGSFIEYREETGYYYLFVSYGQLVANGGYQIREFRSKEVSGPYVDASGETFGRTSNQEEVGVKLIGNYQLPNQKTACLSPGHCSVFVKEDKTIYLAYHQRFDNGTEYHEPRVHQMFMNKEGWLVVAPFATSTETLNDKGYQEKEVAGKYYYVNHGTDISDTIVEAEELILKKDGSIIKGETKIGTYATDDEKPFITLEIDSIVYQGAIVEMLDDASNETLCFSAIGTNNESIWGVLYR